MSRLAITDAIVSVADDDAASARLIRRVLADRGFQHVRLFETGAQLLTAFAEAEPDLVILDLWMPGMDGFAVLERLRADRSDESYLPVLVLTGDVTGEARRRALTIGATDFLMKPFDLDELALRVRNLLETRVLHEDLRRRNAELRETVQSTLAQLTESRDEWVAEAAALSRLEVVGTAEDTARAICFELATLRGIDSSVIFALDSGGQTATLGRSAAADMAFEVNRPVPVDLVRRWKPHLAGGSWVSTWDDVVGSTLERSLIDTQPTGVAIMPLRRGQDILGGLVLTTTEPRGEARFASRQTVLESFASVTMALLGPEIVARQRHGALRGRLQDILSERAFHPVYQPIVDLESSQVVGYEALTRFRDGRRPDRWFADAAAVGLSTELEMACVREALHDARSLPTDAWISLNVSPAVVLERGPIRDLLHDASRPVVLEVTEHVPIEDYGAFRSAVDDLGPDLRFAVDDAGAGFASFRHIIELRPDFVKLDIGLVHEIQHDSARQAFVAGMVYFALKSGCALVAEGIETDAEQETLRTLAVDFGQGYLLGRPAPRNGRSRPVPDDFRRLGQPRESRYVGLS